MLSKRYYITLNPNKKKDKIILDFLKSNYSETETIKSILYLYASQGSKKMQLGEEFIDNIMIKQEQKVDKCILRMHNDTKEKNDNLEIDNDIMNMFK